MFLGVNEMMLLCKLISGSLPYFCSKKNFRELNSCLYFKLMDSVVLMGNSLHHLSAY